MPGHPVLLPQRSVRQPARLPVKYSAREMIAVGDEIADRCIVGSEVTAGAAPPGWMVYLLVSPDRAEIHGDDVVTVFSGHMFFSSHASHSASLLNQIRSGIPRGRFRTFSLRHRQ